MPTTDAGGITFMHSSNLDFLSSAIATFSQRMVRFN